MYNKIIETTHTSHRLPLWEKILHIISCKSNAHNKNLLSWQMHGKNITRK